MQSEHLARGFKSETVQAVFDRTILHLTQRVQEMHSMCWALTQITKASRWALQNDSFRKAVSLQPGWMHSFTGP